MFARGLMSIKKYYINQKEYPSFWDSAFAIQGSVTPRVYKKVLAFTAYAYMISILSPYVPWIKIPISPFEYAGVVMGLVLVFRVNAGYDRWWEARKMWGTIVNCSRNLAVLVKNYAVFSNELERNKTFGLITSLPYLMKNNLRGISSTDEVKSLLDENDYEQLQHWTHKVNFASSQLAAILSSLYKSERINQFAFLKAEKLREDLLDCQGACERILKTPMPFVMAIKSRRFIFLFLLILPMALADYSIIDPLVTALVAYALLSLDQIGVELQNPFSTQSLSHLPLNDICGTIRDNISEIQR